MKKFKLFALMAAMAALFAFPSCDDDDYGLDACFETDYDEYEVGEIIYFNNLSRHAERCYWEFGDGFFSELFNPEYSYRKPGVYEVWLNVYCDEESDDFKKVIRIYEKSVQTPTDPEQQPEQ